jgi:hypothetical protein
MGRWLLQYAFLCSNISIALFIFEVIGLSLLIPPNAIDAPRLALAEALLSKLFLGELGESIFIFYQ